ncbi:MAG: hypothetical protein ABIH23_34845 [bacterium]
MTTKSHRDCIVLAIAFFCILGCSDSEPVPPGTLRIQIPRGIPLEKITIHSDGLSLSDLPMKKRVQDFPFRLSGRPTIKVVLFCPGYQVATLEEEISSDSLCKPWKPKIKEVPMVKFSGKLVDSQENPLPGKDLVVTYLFIEIMSYFGYIDGFVPQVPIAETTTNRDGAFSMKLPSLPDDPFFEKHKGTKSKFSLSVRFEGVRFPPWDVVPSWIDAQKEYKDPLILRLIRHAALRGRLGERFWMANKIEPAAIRTEGSQYPRVDLDAENKKGAHYNCLLKNDGTFNRSLPPGIYDLCLRVIEQGEVPEEKIVVEAELVLKEGEETVINRE